MSASRLQSAFPATPILSTKMVDYRKYCSLLAASGENPTAFALPLPGTRQRLKILGQTIQHRPPAAANDGLGVASNLRRNVKIDPDR
jgi:hypothetical protein